MAENDDLYNFITNPAPQQSNDTFSMDANEFTSYAQHQPQSNQDSWWSNTPFDFGEGGWDTVGEVGGRLLSAPISTFADLVGGVDRMFNPEGTTPLITGGNTFTRIMDVMQMPQEAFLGAVNYGLDRFQDEGATVGEENPIIALEPNKFLDYMAAGVQGVRDNTDFSDVMQNALNLEEKPELYGDEGVFSLSPRKLAALATYPIAPLSRAIDPEGAQARDFWASSLIGQLGTDPMTFVATPLGKAGSGLLDFAKGLTQKIAKNAPEIASKVQLVSKYAMRSEQEIPIMQLQDVWEGRKVEMIGKELDELKPIEKNIAKLTGRSKEYIQEKVLDRWGLKLEDDLYHKLKDPIENGYGPLSPEAKAVIDEILLPPRPKPPRFIDAETTKIQPFTVQPGPWQTLFKDALSTGDGDIDKLIKGGQARVEMMAPQAFMDEVKEMKPFIELQKASLDKIKKLFNKGEKFDIPYIDERYSNEDGFHRAFAALKSNIPEIPVLRVSAEAPRMVPPKPIADATARASGLLDFSGMRPMPRDEYMRTGLLLKQAREASIVRDIKAGVVTPGLSVDEQANYASMLIKNRHIKTIKKALGLSDLQIKQAKQGLEKSWKNFTFKKINDLSREGKLPGKLNGIKFVDGILETNPIKIEMVQRMKAIQSRANIGLALQAADTMGSQTKKEGWSKLSTWLAKNKEVISPEIYKRLENVYFHPDHLKHLEARLDLEVLPDMYKSWLKGYDDLKTSWVATTLAFPSTVIKNIAGNDWNYRALGKMPFEFYEKMKGIQMGTAGDVVDLGEKFGKIETSRLQDLMRDFDVEASGLTAINNADFIARHGEEGRISGVVGKIPPVKLMKRFNRVVEDNGRGAFFMYRLSEGDSPMQAALATKKFGLDYLTGLSDFENAVLKRVFPFYAWTRLNLPLQLEQMVTNPKPFIRLAELVNLATDDETARKVDSYHESVVPQMAKDAGIPIRTGEDGLPEYFMLGGWLPAADLAFFSNGPTGILHKLYQMVNPLITRPIESIANFDPAIGRKLSDSATGMTQRIQVGPFGTDIDKRITNIARVFRAVSVMDQLSKGFIGNELTQQEYSIWRAASKLLFGATTYTANVKYGQRKVNNEIKDIRWTLKNTRLREGEREALQERLSELQGTNE